MTTPDAAAIAGSLTPNMAKCLIGIFSGFEVGDRFRLDEGEHHAPYSALVRIGLLDKQRIGDSYTTYSLTPTGYAVRAYLQEHPNG